jgi:hypothetical protein
MSVLFLALLAAQTPAPKPPPQEKGFPARP